MREETKSKLDKIRKSRIFEFICVILFIAVCAVVGCTLSYLNHEDDPTETALEYFRAFVSEDYETMYEYVDTSSGYVNKTLYMQKMKEMRASYSITSYDIEEGGSSGGHRQVTIKCENENGEMDFVITFNAHRGWFQIIPDYSVNIDNMMTSNLTVMIDSDRTLILNGETVTEDDVSVTESDGISTYVFSDLIAGDYDIESADEYSAVTAAKSVTESDVTIDLTNGELTASSEYKALIDKKAGKIIKQFYKAVRKRNTDSEKLLSCFKSTKKIKKQIKKAVKESMEVIFWPDQKNIDSYEVRNFDLQQTKEKITYDEELGTYTAVFTCSYDYTCSTDTALYNSYIYTLSGSCTSKMTISFDVDGDNVIASGISVTNKNKKDD